MTTHIEFLKTFIKKYDAHNNLSFSNIKIFPETKIIFPFGAIVKDKQIEFNIGTYFGKEKIFLYKTFSPFLFEKVSYLKDLNIIILKSFFGFSVRIYNVKGETLSKEFLSSLHNSKYLDKGTLICKSGKPKPRKNTLAYIEIVSDLHTNFLHDLLTIKYNSSLDREMKSSYIMEILDIFGIDHKDGLRNFRNDIENKSIKFFNPFYTVKYDPLEKKDLCFYSWNALFN